MSETIFKHIIREAESQHFQLAQAISTIGPLTLEFVQDVTVAEKLCRSIAGQQLSVKAAQTIWGRVLDSAQNKNLLSHLHQVSTEQLRQCGLSAAKTKAIKGVAQQAMDNALDCDDLRQLSVNQREQRLLTLWGVGQWTVDMINIFYFGEPDIWPSADVTARKTLLKLCSKSEDDCQIAADFSPYRSYLALYMYAIADARPD